MVVWVGDISLEIAVAPLWYRYALYLGVPGHPNRLNIRIGGEWVVRIIANSLRYVIWQSPALLDRLAKALGAVRIGVIIGRARR